MNGWPLSHQRANASRHCIDDVEFERSLFSVRILSWLFHVESCASIKREKGTIDRMSPPSAFRGSLGFSVCSLHEVTCECKDNQRCSAGEEETI